MKIDAMKRWMLIGTVVVTTVFAYAGISYSVFPGKQIVFEGGGAGKVVFNGLSHRGRQKGCADCHPDVFPMSRTTKITMNDINAGKFCGHCHNGKDAFDAKDCAKCHEK